MPTYLQLYRLAAAGLTALLFTSCASTAPSRLYVLYSPEELAPISSDIDTSFHWVAVGPIRFPAELERPLVITQSSEGELAYSEVHRWGSSIDRQLEQVLLTNISILLDSPGGVHKFPGPDAAVTDYRVAIHIDELTGQLGQSASLQARWMLFRPGATSLMISQSSSFTCTLPNSSYLAYVNAQSEMLADLSREIAQALIEIPAIADEPEP